MKKHHCYSSGHPWLGWEYTEQYQYKYKQKLIQIKNNTDTQVVIHGWGGSTLSNNGQVQVEDDMART